MAGDKNSDRNSGKKWFVVEAYEGKDFDVCLRLAAAGFNVWRPVKQVVIARRIKVGCYERVEKARRNVARFGRYLFVELVLTDSVYQAIKHAPGVRGFLTMAGSDAPAKIDSNYIAFLRGAPEIAETKDVFHSRDRVRITVGPFNGVEAVVKEVDSRKVPVVTINAFGGMTSFPIDACYLELLALAKPPMGTRDKRRTRRRSIAHV